jgi:hypothetical protein
MIRYLIEITRHYDAKATHQMDLVSWFRSSL